MVTRIRMSPVPPQRNPTRLRSEEWLNNPDNPGMTALYVERLVNYGLTRNELQSGRPVIGISQTGSDIAPCNRSHIENVERIKAGVRDAGGIPFVFPVHPIQETVRRPTAALDRNLAYLGMVEIIHGYPFDGVVFTTGCDKTTPAALDGRGDDESAEPLPELRPHARRLAQGRTRRQRHHRVGIAQAACRGEDRLRGVHGPFLRQRAERGPLQHHGHRALHEQPRRSAGHDPARSAAIPAPYRERGQMAYETGRRIVEMVREDLTPSKIMTRAAFENAIVVNSAIGGSTNCPPHLIAIARHLGVDLDIQDWQTVRLRRAAAGERHARRQVARRSLPSRRWRARRPRRTHPRRTHPPRTRSP